MQQKRMASLSNSLFDSEANRRILQVKFGLSTENLRAYVGMITEETNGFLTNELKASNTWQGFDALHAMGELTILTASRTLQGKEVRNGLDKTFAKRYEDLDGGFTPINFMFPKLPLPSYRRRDKAQKAMSEFYQGIIRKRREGTHDVSTVEARFGISLTLLA